MEHDKTAPQPSLRSLADEDIDDAPALEDIDYPVTQLDQLLNDLQGNAARVESDDGLARFGESRLRAIRTNALAQSAAAWLAESCAKDEYPGL
ncbi:hypothetical protein [Dyella silvatica]|uniref:hypothetical protein n=1 Tax=Dyella silvatica TaxID=2992128 RepID=UPI002251FF5A|nr:hypothetical protein [Dyella silvatica]